MSTNCVFAFAFFFFFNDPATTEIYTLPLHDALPISSASRSMSQNSSRVYPRLSDSTASCRLTPLDRKSTRLNSSHSQISYAVFCLKKKKDGAGALLLLSEASRLRYALAPHRTAPHMP